MADPSPRPFHYLRMPLYAIAVALVLVAAAIVFVGNRAATKNDVIDVQVGFERYGEGAGQTGDALRKCLRHGCNAPVTTDPATSTSSTAPPSDSLQPPVTAPPATTAPAPRQTVDPAR